jgi:hypothetical protein
MPSTIVLVSTVTVTSSNVRVPTPPASLGVPPVVEANAMTGRSSSTGTTRRALSRTWDRTGMTVCLQKRSDYCTWANSRRGLRTARMGPLVDIPSGPERHDGADRSILSDEPTRLQRHPRGTTPVKGETP